MTDRVVRGPDGKFKSVDSAEYDRFTAFRGTLDSTIPAADLSGGTGTNSVQGTESTVIDFDLFLDSDEVFVPQRLHFMTSHQLPTTATAESSSQLDFVYRGDAGDLVPNAGSVFYGGPALDEEGIADIRAAESNEADILHGGKLAAENSHSDSTNGLAAGADHGFDSITLDATAMGSPWTFDADDEIAVPHDVQFDNVSDHAIQTAFAVVAQGGVREL